MNPTSSVAMAYFGKIPSRGDFVRSAGHAALTRTLDHWLTRGVELMATDPRWKEAYDRAAPMHFAFLGVKSHAALAGHLIASADSSGRRFPFIAAGTFDVASPMDFMARGPLVMTPLWAGFEQAARQAVAASHAAPVLGALNQTTFDVELAPQAYDAAFREFLDQQTLASLQTMLRSTGPALNLRRMLLALGMLLQPVSASRHAPLDKGLSLPLPSDPRHVPLVATMWTKLVSKFLERGDFEIVLFMRNDAQAGAQSLEIGFSGGSPALLHAALDPQVGRTMFVNLADADWVETRLHQDGNVQTLSSSLDQPRLPLRQALSRFDEAFL